MNEHARGINARRREGLAEQVAGDLGVRIVAGEFDDRPSLPTEIEIQTEFSVSRTAVREAIRLLSAKGLIETRPKTGTRVRPRSDWNLLDPDVLRWQLEAGPEPEFIENLFSMRAIFEPEAARSAALHATDDKIEMMRRSLDDMILQPLGSIEQVEADLAFHKSILEGSGNSLLRSLGSLIESALLAMFRINWMARSTSHVERMDMHRAVFLAIEARKASEAANAMQILIDSSKADSLAAIANPTV
jgi:GntR family galactonate operon transcriptional repressor